MKANNSGQRLQKVIANSGFSSRRKAESLIASGKVKINDVVVTTLGKKVFTGDVVKVNNKVLPVQNYIYLVFYKPINCLTTLKDPKKRPTIMSYFSDIKVRIYPVGRLDFDTSGLLLMTNDGEFSNQILHPKYKIAKIYQVVCQGILATEQINKLENGVAIGSGVTTAAAKVKIINSNSKKQTTEINLTIYQGYKNQIKKMLLAVDSKVLQLKRIAIGDVTLKNLKPGGYRVLSAAEKNSLLNLAQKNYQ